MFCKKCLDEWKEHRDSCPTCVEPVTETKTSGQIETMISSASQAFEKLQEKDKRIKQLETEQAEM
jgi:predicted amidophosphoribosyltransferase